MSPLQLMYIYMGIFTLSVIIIWYYYFASPAPEKKLLKARVPVRFSLPIKKLGLPKILSVPSDRKKLTAPAFFRRAVSIKGKPKFPLKSFAPPPGRLKAEIIPSYFKYKEYEILPTRDQKACGSCWAFATAGAIGDAVALKSGGKIRQFLSPQELLDCAKVLADSGNNCDGNDIQMALDYAQQKGVCLDSEYPYQAKVGECSPGNSKVYIKNIATVTGGSNPVLNMKRALMKNGPLTVFMNVHDDLYNYDGKSIYKPGEGAENLGGHSVEIFGWCDAGANTKEPGMDGAYWIVKNSWGPSWTKDNPNNYGWFYITMGENTCDIESYAQTFEVELPESQIEHKKNYYSSFDEFYSDRQRKNWLGNPSDFGSGGEGPEIASTQEEEAAEKSNLLPLGIIIAGNVGIYAYFRAKL